MIVMMPSAEHRCGTVALVGRANVGKSTLLNTFIGEKVAIVSPRPGTTRNRILGVLTRPDAQIAFLDTPGFGPSHTLLEKRLLQTARAAWGEADLLILVIDGARGLTQEDRRLIEALPPERPPRLLALNKIDRVAKRKLLPQMAEAAQLASWAALIPISATTGDGVDELLRAVVGHLPVGRALFPADHLTDSPTRFLAAELIREQALRVTYEEVPHAVAVQIDEFVLRRQRTTRRVHGHERRGPSRSITYIRATILIERDSQKGIVIGAHGERLKSIGAAARPALEALVGQAVYLDLWVKVWPRWREQPQALRQLGY